MASARHEVETLLALRAVGDLDATEETRLEAMLARHPDLDDDGFERAAAALTLALVPAAPEIPPSLEARLASAAEQWAAAPQEAPAGTTAFRARQPERGTRTASLTGWLAAAAALVVAALAWWPLGTPDVEISETGAALVPAAEELRRQLLASAPDAVTIAWSRTEDPSSVSASGDVVWSPQQQRGFMRFAGLAVNDASEFQYQLWIFDAGRDERYPVDGGVFDVTDSGEIVVEIDPKLPVGQAALFAITVEQPGGVVVSSRERIALLAQAGG